MIFATKKKMCDEMRSIVGRKGKCVKAKHLLARDSFARLHDESSSNEESTTVE